MKNTNIRQSNFELMRIVSMIYISMWHFLVYGHLRENLVGMSSHIGFLLMALFAVHVNSFVLLTGYFNYNKEFKLSKTIKIINQMWFYKVVILLIFILGLGYSFTKFEIYKIISPIPRFDTYWFLGVYIILYLISPILNIVIKNTDKNKHKNIIIVLFILSVITYITSNEFMDLKWGYCIFSFSLLYFIGAYLNKYPIEKSQMFKSFSKNKILLFSLFLYLFLIIFNMLLRNFGVTISNSNSNFVKYYSDIMVRQFTSYANPINIIATVCYFIFFSMLKFKNRVINFGGKYILGVYLITENPIFRDWLYPFLGFNKKAYSFKHIILAFAYTIVIVIICVLIEFIRSLIYRFFYKRKCSSSLRERIQSFLYSLNINVKW